jgi:hypothetical protein
MRINHVLIDYENVQPVLADALSQTIFKVWIFIGVQQTKVKVDLLDLMQRKGADVHIVRMASAGRNLLDFHMAYYLGELATRDISCYLHVITKDTGLDPLLAHLRERGIEAARWSSVFDIPIAKTPAATPEDDKLSRIIEYLMRRGKQRPASMKTLVGSAAALFQPRLEQAEVLALLEKLRITGVFEVIDNKVVYGLPD